MIISKNSWHYELYQVGVSGGSAVDESSLNFCQYSRKVVFGVIFSMFLVLLGVVAGVLVLEPVLSTTLWAFGDHPFMTFFGGEGGKVIWSIVIAFIIFAIVGLTVGGISELNYMRKRKKEERRREELGKDYPMTALVPGFFETWYTSFKDKVCIKVEIEK